MATNKRGKTNNPEGRNQYSGGLIDSAKERPFAAAAAVGGAVVAGVFLWSRRNQISDQISGLSEQLSEWREGITSDNGGRTQSDIAEEALTLKETGKKAKHPADPLVEEQTKVGAVAF